MTPEEIKEYIDKQPFPPIIIPEESAYVVHHDGKILTFPTRIAARRYRQEHHLKPFQEKP